MDIVLGAHQGPPVVLRNNGDGSFTAMHPFAGISGLRGFAWVDLDGDGNPDAAMIDGSGTLHFFHNQRGGVFRELALPQSAPCESSDGCRCKRRRERWPWWPWKRRARWSRSPARAKQAWNVAELGNAPRLAQKCACMPPTSITTGRWIC
jgi:hypothetical protein